MQEHHYNDEIDPHNHNEYPLLQLDVLFPILGLCCVAADIYVRTTQVI